MSKTPETQSQLHIKEELIKQALKWATNEHAYFEFDTKGIYIAIPHLEPILIKKEPVKGFMRLIQPYRYSISYETISYRLEKGKYEWIYEVVGHSKRNTVK